MTNKRNSSFYGVGKALLASYIDMGPKQEPMPSRYKYIILVNSKTRCRTNDYNDALDEYYAIADSYKEDGEVIVVQLIDTEGDGGTIAEYRP